MLPGFKVSIRRPTVGTVFSVRERGPGTDRKRPREDEAGAHWGRGQSSGQSKAKDLSVLETGPWCRQLSTSPVLVLLVRRDYCPLPQAPPRYCPGDIVAAFPAMWEIMAQHWTLGLPLCPLLGAAAAIYPCWQGLGEGICLCTWIGGGLISFAWARPLTDVEEASRFVDTIEGGP